MLNQSRNIQIYEFQSFVHLLIPVLFYFVYDILYKPGFHQLILFFIQDLGMGCGASQAGLPAQSIYGSKCVPVDILSPENKKKIRKIIEKDNLVELAITISQLNVPLNVELSDIKSKWFMTHFCARWDSANCLQYLLKHYFVGSAIGYIDYVNATTVDGETPLHLTATYKCDSAFAVLHYFGGLNLNARDKNSYTPLQTAQSNKAKNISQALKKYRDMNTNFTNIDAERLTSGKLMSQEQKNKVDVKVDKTKQQNNQNTVSEEQKNLMIEKKKIQQMMSDLQKQKLQLQFKKEEEKIKVTQNDKKVGEKQRYEKEMQDKINQELKKEKQKYDIQMKQQQAQLQKLKDQIRKAEDERIAKQKQQAQRLAQKYAAQQEEKLKQLAKDKEKEMQEMKRAKQQQLNENPEGDEQAKKKKQQPQQQQTPEQAVKGLLQALQGHGIEIPPNIQQMYRKALQAGEFVDEQFPPDNTALGDPNNERYYQMTDRIVWLRPIDIFGEDEPFQVFQQGIDANDINQGQLGVCYMLAAVSSMAQYPDRIESLFVYADTNIGFYVLKLYKDGIPQFIVVDDLIPCDVNSNAPIFTKPAGSQLWVMLIQKCWSKVMGGYFDAEGMMPDLMMEDLSGAPGFGQKFYNPNKQMTFANHIDIIYNHIQEGHSVVISTGYNNIVDGIVENHAYSLLNLFKIKDRYIFKIRNPWGRTQFEGTYSENSKQLTQQIKDIIEYDPNLEDGIFYLSASQVQRFYQDYSISVLLETHLYSYIEFTSKMQESIYFKFTLTQKSVTNIRVTQPFDRMIKDKSYRHAPVVIEVGKIQKNGKVKYIDEGEGRSIHGNKSIHAFQKICEELQAGDYFVRVRMVWPNEQQYNSAVLSVYAIEGVQIQQLEQQQGLQLLKQLYISHAVNAKQRGFSNDNIGSFKIDGMKGQFIFVAETDKPGNYKAKFAFYNAFLTGVAMQIGMTNALQAQCLVSKGNPGVITTQIQFPEMLGGVQGNISCNFVKV